MNRHKETMKRLELDINRHKETMIEKRIELMRIELMRIELEILRSNLCK